MRKGWTRPKRVILVVENGFRLREARMDGDAAEAMLLHDPRCVAFEGRNMSAF